MPSTASRRRARGSKRAVLAALGKEAVERSKAEVDLIWRYLSKHASHEAIFGPQPHWSEAARRLCLGARLVRCSEGDVLFRQGEDGGHAFLLLNGTCNLHFTPELMVAHSEGAGEDGKDDDDMLGQGDSVREYTAEELEEYVGPVVMHVTQGAILGDAASLVSTAEGDTSLHHTCTTIATAKCMLVEIPHGTLKICIESAPATLTLQNLVMALSEMQIFRSWSTAELTFLAKWTTRQEIEEGHNLFTEGSVVHHVYFLLQGEIVVSSRLASAKHTSSGKQQLEIEHVTPPSVLGEHELVLFCAAHAGEDEAEGKRREVPELLRRYSAQATCTSVVVSIPSQLFEALVLDRSSASLMDVLDEAGFVPAMAVLRRRVADREKWHNVVGKSVQQDGNSNHNAVQAKDIQNRFLRCSKCGQTGHSTTECRYEHENGSAVAARSSSGRSRHRHSSGRSRSPRSRQQPYDDDQASVPSWAGSLSGRDSATSHEGRRHVARARKDLHRLARGSVVRKSLSGSGHGRRGSTGSEASGASIRGVSPAGFDVVVIGNSRDTLQMSPHSSRSHRRRGSLGRHSHSHSNASSGRGRSTPDSINSGTRLASLLPRHVPSPVSGLELDARSDTSEYRNRKNIDREADARAAALSLLRGTTPASGKRRGGGKPASKVLGRSKETLKFVQQASFLGQVTFHELDDIKVVTAGSVNSSSSSVHTRSTRSKGSSSGYSGQSAAERLNLFSLKQHRRSSGSGSGSGSDGFIRDGRLSNAASGTSSDRGQGYRRRSRAEDGKAGEAYDDDDPMLGAGSSAVRARRRARAQQAAEDRSKQERGRQLGSMRGAGGASYRRQDHARRSSAARQGADLSRSSSDGGMRKRRQALAHSPAPAPKSRATANHSPPQLSAVSPVQAMPTHAPLPATPRRPVGSSPYQGTPGSAASGRRRGVSRAEELQSSSPRTASPRVRRLRQAQQPLLQVSPIVTPADAMRPSRPAVKTTTVGSTADGSFEVDEVDAKDSPSARRAVAAAGGQPRGRGRRQYRKIGELRGAATVPAVRPAPPSSLRRRRVIL